MSLGYRLQAVITLQPSVKSDNLIYDCYVFSPNYMWSLKKRAGGGGNIKSFVIRMPFTQFGFIFIT